jgi:hypothetical protein
VITKCDKNTNIGPTQRACSSASGIPKQSASISIHCITTFPLLSQPLGLWLRSTAWYKSAVLLVQSFSCSAHRLLLSYQISDLPHWLISSNTTTTITTTETTTKTTTTITTTTITITTTTITITTTTTTTNNAFLLCFLLSESFLSLEVD